MCRSILSPQYFYYNDVDFKPAGRVQADAKLFETFQEPLNVIWSMSAAEFTCLMPTNADAGTQIDWRASARLHVGSFWVSHKVHEYLIGDFPEGLPAWLKSSNYLGWGRNRKMFHPDGEVSECAFQRIDHIKISRCLAFRFSKACLIHLLS